MALDGSAGCWYILFGARKPVAACARKRYSRGSLRQLRICYSLIAYMVDLWGMSARLLIASINFNRLRLKGHGVEEQVFYITSKPDQVPWKDSLELVLYWKWYSSNENKDKLNPYFAAGVK